MHSFSDISLSTYCVQTLSLAHSHELDSCCLEGASSTAGETGQKGGNYCSGGPGYVRAPTPGKASHELDRFFHPWPLFSGASGSTQQLEVTEATAVRQQISLNSHTPSCGCAQMPPHQWRQQLRDKLVILPLWARCIISRFGHAWQLPAEEPAEGLGSWDGKQL